MLNRLALLLAILLVLLVGCKKQEEAPLFGSTPKLSTPAGFLEGKWQEWIDTSEARYSYGEAVNDNPNRDTLEFFKGGEYELVTSGHKVRGHWQENGKIIELEPLSMDGTDIQVIQNTGGTSDGSFAMMIALTTTKIELDADKRRLVNANTTSFGSKILGRVMWIRVMDGKTSR